MREQLADRRNESVHELVVAFAANSWMAIAQVKWVIQEIEVVRTNVQNDWDHPPGMRACRSDIEMHFPHRYLDAADPPVADPEYPFRIGRHDQIYVISAEPVVVD